MLAAITEINLFGVLAGTAVFAVLGYVWFSFVVARLYRVALGRPVDAPGPSGALDYAGPIVASFVIVLTTAVLMRALGIESVGDALILGAFIGIGYLTTMTFVIAINPNFPRPLLYGLINAPYFVLSILIASVLLVVIR